MRKKQDDVPNVDIFSNLSTTRSSSAKYVLHSIRNTMKFSQYLYEGFRTKDFEQAVNLIVQYIEKHIGTLYKYPDIEQFKGSNGQGIGLRYFLQDGTSIRFNWISTTANSKLDSIAVWAGTTNYPNFYIKGIDGTPLGQMSMAKILPTLIKTIQAPVVGEVELSKQESTEIHTELDNLLTESVLKEDAYDDVVNALEQGPVSSHTFAKMGRNQERIFKEILLAHKDEFDIKVDAGGRQKYTLLSVPVEFDREEIIGAVVGNQAKKARIGLSVSTGGNEEVITDGELAAEKQYPAALAHIPYEEQLEDLKTIVAAVAKGASNFCVVLGAGGLGKCLDPNTNLLVSLGNV